jgi:hypothetical protein
LTSELRNFMRHLFLYFSGGNPNSYRDIPRRGTAASKLDLVVFVYEFGFSL